MLDNAPARNVQAWERCRTDLRAFCEVYNPDIFYRPFSGDHLKIIKRMESVVLDGGMYAIAAPRSQGKTALCEQCCMWALLYGHRRFVGLVGASEVAAKEMFNSIKTLLESNELLYRDFSETTVPIRALEGISRRAESQLCHGERTMLRWTTNEIVFPTYPKSESAGARLSIAGITGRIRGMRYTRPDGKTVRPDIIVIDDPQTDQSASSNVQIEYRYKVITRGILGAVDPEKKAAVMMPCTVIEKGDMADRVLDRDKHPEWNGERLKLLYSFPDDMKLWDEYRQIRNEEARAGRGNEKATDFYRVNQAAMDKGAVVSWLERHDPDQLSAVQYAMDIYLTDEYRFFAEYQNEPLDDRHDDTMLSPDELMMKVNRLKKREVPIDVSHITAFVDVQQEILFWSVIGWSDEFTGYVLDYGEFPKQPQSRYSIRNLSRTLSQTFPRMGLEARLFAGLEKTTGELCGLEFTRDDGAAMKIDRLLIDASWGASTDVIYRFVRQCNNRTIILPSHGRAIKASSKPMNEWQLKPGDRAGLNWRVPVIANRRQVRHAIYDVNFWKTFVMQRFATPMGDAGCLSLFGSRPEAHRLFVEHLTAESKETETAGGRTLEVWKLDSSKPDNHWLDCVVGCAVGASMLGAKPPDVPLDQREMAAKKQKKSSGGKARRKVQYLK